VSRGDVVLGVDTMIDLDGNPVGKPGSPPQATRMLSRLSGRTHEVVSGFAVVLAGRGRATLGVARTAVRFHHLGFEEIAAYVATGEPLDKAGAYAIQAAGAALVAEVTGSTANVAGLPLEALGSVLTGYGVAAAVRSELHPTGSRPPPATPPR
jgi:septum formation protein